MGPDPCQYFKSSPRGYQCVIRLKNHWTKVKQKFHYPSLDLSFPQEFGSLLKGGGREDYFQNMRRKLEKINPAHTQPCVYTDIHTETHEQTDTHRYKGTYTHTQIHEQTDTRRHTNIHTDTQADMHTQTHTKIHTLNTHKQTLQFTMSFSF